MFCCIKPVNRVSLLPLDYRHNSDSVEHMDTDSEPLDASENESRILYTMLW